MESALLIRRKKKETKKKGKVLFINAFDEIKNEKTISFLLDRHIDNIYKAYLNFKDVEGFAKLVDISDIKKNNGSLLVTNYVQSSRIETATFVPFKEVYNDWEKSSKALSESINQLFKIIG